MASSILIVDDEELLLRFFRAVLERAGWTVVSASSPEEAWRLLEKGSVDNALIDYVLPGGNGVDFAVELRRHYPKMRITLTSGYIRPGRGYDGVFALNDFTFLQKPFLPADLLRHFTSEAPIASEGLRVFESYSHSDDKFRQKLEKHLALLRRNHLVQLWSDARISPGKELDAEIKEALEMANLILLLVSADFMASDYCCSKEMKHAIERHEAGEARVIPIILRPVDWHAAPFGKLKALPRDGRPITTWPRQDEGLADVARGIAKVIEELTQKRQI